MIVEAPRGAQKSHQLCMVPSSCRTHFGKNEVPVRVFTVQTLQGIRDTLVSNVGDHCRITDTLTSYTREAPYKLKQDCQASVHVMYSSNLQLRQVKSLAEHADTDDDFCFPALQRSKSHLCFIRLGMDQYRIEIAGNRLINSCDDGGSRDTGAARH
ncbi:hypothetical protein D3C77_193420 [compost metagenome]